MEHVPAVREIGHSEISDSVHATAIAGEKLERIAPSAAGHSVATLAPGEEIVAPATHENIVRQASEHNVINRRSVEAEDGAALDVRLGAGGHILAQKHD